MCIRDRSLCDQLAHASGSLNILFSIPVWYALMGAAVWVVLGSSRLFTSCLVYTSKRQESGRSHL